MKYLMIFLLSLSLYAQDNKLIEQLNDDNFEVREKITKQLGEAEEEYCEKYLNLIDKYNSPEIRARLLLAAKLIHSKKTAPKSLTWLTFYADTGFETDLRYTTPDKFGNTNHLEVVSWVEGRLQHAIHQNDIITKINGVDVDQTDKQFLTGSTYNLTIKRYKELNAFEDYNIDIEGKEFTEFEVKIVVAKKEKYNVEDEKIMLDNLWQAYFTNYLKSKK